MGFRDFMNKVFDGIESLDIEADVKVLNSNVTVNADGIGAKVSRPKPLNEKIQQVLLENNQCDCIEGKCIDCSGNCKCHKDSTYEINKEGENE